MIVVFMPSIKLNIINIQIKMFNDKKNIKY